MTSPSVPGVDRLLRVAKHALDAPIVMFAAVDDQRQRFVGEIGLPTAWSQAGETPLSHSYCSIVVERDEPLVVDHARNDERVCDNPATAEANIGAYLGVPVRSPDGYVLGAFCAITTNPRTWSGGDIATLTDLAMSVEVELELRRLTDELSDQLAAEQLERSFEASMASIATATSSSWTAQAVVSALVEHGQEVARAALVSVATVENGQLHYFHSDGVADEVAAQWDVGQIDDPLPMAHAARTGQTVVLPSLESFAPWPAFVEAARDLDIRSFAALPVGDAEGGQQAVVGIGWAHSLASTTLPRSVVLLAALARQGLDRAHSHQTARDHAELLESLVLPDQLPQIDAVELAGLYLPPTAGQRVGGDLYEATQRDDGTIALIVADAAGHDLAASRATSRLRTALNMLTLEKRQPAEILSYVNTYLQRSNVTTLITCVYALIDPAQRTVTIANAGHPQPRIRRADGSVESVGPLGQPLLGFAPFDYGELTDELGIEDTIVLFTDGLIERRSVPLERGENWLDNELSRGPTIEAQALASRLVTDLTVLDDDVAVLVARHTGQTELASRFESTAPADRLQLAATRTALREWLDDHRYNDDRYTDDVLLVATELLSNARAASDPADAELVLRVFKYDGHIDITVTNQGPPFRTSPGSMPDAERLGGRGLSIAAALSDLSSESRPPTVSVTARIPKTRAESTPG